MRKKKIGEFLVKKGLLTPDEMKNVLEHAERARVKFSEAAIDLGLLRNDRPLRRSKYDFFHLDAQYFPNATRTLFPTATLLKHGVVPLGFKTTYRLFQAKKILNLGFLDPDKGESVALIQSEANQKLGKEIAGTHVYLVLPEEFVEVMDQVYHVNEQALRRCPTDDLEPTLTTFLHSHDENAPTTTGSPL